MVQCSPSNMRCRLRPQFPDVVDGPSWGLMGTRAEDQGNNIIPKGYLTKRKAFGKRRAADRGSSVDPPRKEAEAIRRTDGRWRTLRQISHGKVRTTRRSYQESGSRRRGPTEKDGGPTVEARPDRVLHLQNSPRNVNLLAGLTPLSLFI